MTRKESREQAFILLFEYSFNGESADELFETAADAGFYVEDEFCCEVVKKAIENIESTDAAISEFAKGWKTDRLSKVVLAALRLAVTEIRYFDSIPDSVSINEAVEMIKKYATEQDAAFANGILGSIVKAKG